ncbi:ABC transporter substrate-binding protein [Pararhizobium mangrovi]|uniref:ABC transporter substrate-binding protein n=1 Tax=Pararhizobium mangrovi TaxID=2590452 RepID=A0A506UET9_9HYPH|nr:ABC transporter substrate-binding protein [Pararhizobium mangrovi]TPW31986.1 ABC transporter substrate-binding protein [Pararhizobium mangrovi]
MNNPHLRNAFAAFLLAGTAAIGLPMSAHAADPVSTVVNITQIFKSLDPARVTDYTGYMAVVNMYDGLTTVNEAGKIVPQLAKSWDISKDGLTYTFHLRDDVKFQNGTPMKASDVVYTIQRMLAINEGPSHLIDGLVDAKNVKAPDDHTVVVKLNKPFSPFMAVTPLILVVNEDEIKANAKSEWGKSYVADHSVGSGPYQLVSYNRSADLVMKRNPDYFLGWPNGTPIDQLRFVQTSDEATVKALAQKGELGMSSSSLSTDTVQAIGKLPNYKLIDTTTATGFTMKLNTQRAPTDDVYVRKAIALATDYNTIQTIIQPGKPMTGPLPPVFKDAHDDSIKPGQYDLKAANAELAKSKYAGKPIKVTLSYVDALSFEQEVALLMQANLSSIGITVDIQPQPWNRIVDMATKPTTTPNITEVNIGPTYPSPDSMFYPQYDSMASGTWLSMEWLDDKTTDDLIAKARATPEVKARNAIYKQIQQRIMKLQPTVFANAPVRHYAASKCLQGYKYIPMQSWDLNFWNYHWDCSAK